MKRIMLLMAFFLIVGCDNVGGQYRHNKDHHDQQDQKSDEFKKTQNKAG